MRMLRSISVTGQISVESSALFVPGPLATGDSSDDGLTHHLERADKSSACAGTAWRGKNKSIAAKALCAIEENPRKGTRVTCARKVTREQRLAEIRDFEAQATTCPQNFGVNSTARWDYPSLLQIFTPRLWAISRTFKQSSLDCRAIDTNVQIQRLPRSVTAPLTRLPTW